MEPPLPKLSSLFFNWKEICDKYSSIHAEIPQKYSLEKADQKEESVVWEQIAFELMVTLFTSLNIPFEATANDVQRIVKSTEGVDKEIDFSIRVKSKEIYFGVTSFSDSEKDFLKDVNEVSVDIPEIKYPDGTVSTTAKISSYRPHHLYLNRRLAVRVAKEGKHKLDSDYVYICFPKAAIGFGGGIDAISKDFSFHESDYTYKTNGITGLILIGEYSDIQSQKMCIVHDVWLVKTVAFPHASPTVRAILGRLDNITIDMRPKFQEMREMLAPATA